MKIDFPDAGPIDFLEQFNENILLKQENGKELKIFNLINQDKSKVIKNFQTPEAFIFIYEKDLFLCMYKGNLKQYNINTGELVSDFEDEQIYHRNLHPQVPYVA